MLFKVVCLLVAVVLSIATCSSSERNGTFIAPSSNSSAQAKVLRAARSGTKYIAFLERLNFFEACQACESYGLRLASVTSAADTNEIQVALNNAKAEQWWTFWIAGTDLGRSRSFLWITTGKPIWRPNLYLNWYPGQPDNHGGIEYCIEVYHESANRWNDNDCNVRQRFVCQVDYSSC
ncbi:salivary C-type lectin [Culex quinquefasciatus]|uniref:Salivary C-type lectin n=1 Tax=Culex quinquefasciatus TaxID=7176 RepID=B0WML9_CULQU|nr:salivary C-type lectin [Culex quinquefasciatus]|eukprot:XP_001849953.1 salivary C-type lectin [Culex quinquefasciatus]